MVLQTAIECAVEVLELDMGVIYLAEGEMLYLGAASPPLPPSLPDEHRYAQLRDHPHLDHCLSDLAPVVVEDVRKEVLSEKERLVVESGDLRSAIFAPLAVKGEPLGALIVRKDAVEHISAGSGRHFDPAVVEVFLDEIGQPAGA